MIFGNYLFNYAVKQVLAENHPTKDYEHCLNRRQVKHKCTVCRDICPRNVYSGVGSRNADFTDCRNCNLCVAACPARCIASSALNVSAYLKLLKVPEESVYIAVRDYEGDAHLRVDDFAALSWEYLACLALRKNVVFLTAGQPVGESGAQEVWQETLVRLVLFFGKEEYGRRFSFSSQLDYTNDQKIGRRDLFRKANEELRSKASSFLPSESRMDGLLYRYLLKRIIGEADASRSFGWILPMISPECRGCNVCGKLCPQQAIVVRRQEEHFQVVFFPFRCNKCGLCQKTCIHHAIPDFGLIHVGDLRPMILFDSQMDEKE